MNAIDLGHFDGLLSLLAAFGLWPVWKRLHPTDSLNPLEKKLYWMLVYLFVLLLMRVPYLGFSVVPFFGPMTYVGASLFAFMVFLYFETLLRRHMPLVVKIYAATGTAYFVIASLLGFVHGDYLQMKLLGAFYFSLSIMTCTFTIFRKRADYSTSENRLINLSVAALFVLGPFFITDILAHATRELPRLGSVGALLFAYVSLYNQALFMKSAYLLRKLFKALAFSFVSWLPIYGLLPDLPNYVHFRFFMLLYAVNLIFRIWYAVKHLDGEDDLYGFVKAVSESDKNDVRSFLKGMKEYFSGVELKVFRHTDFETYRIAQWSLYFKKMKTDSFSVFDLQKLIADESTSAEEKEYLEEMVDMLERFDMTHVCLLGKQVYYVILFQVPMVGYSSMIQLKTKLVGEFARLIER